MRIPRVSVQLDKVTLWGYTWEIGSPDKLGFLPYWHYAVGDRFFECTSSTCRYKLEEHGKSKRLLIVFPDYAGLLIDDPEYRIAFGKLFREEFQ